MKTQHTPGPWIIESGVGFYSIICRDGGKYDGATIAHEVCNGEANAQLIAAAPDLLEACKYAVRELGPESEGVCCWQAFDALQAAIAKAEGK